MRLRVILAAGALALAGCGGNDEKPASSDTISAASWSSKVTAICKQTEKQAKADGEKIGRDAAKNGDSEAELTRKLMAYISQELPPIQDKIDALPKPEGKEAQADKFSKEMRHTADIAGNVATAIKDNDETKGKQAVNDLVTSVKSARALARSLNIAECNPSAGSSFG